jgi:hypothetical protein
MHKVLDILAKVIQETSKPCWKQQSLVGNNKASPETTKPCWKRQRFAGNNKAFLVLSSLNRLNLGNIIEYRG